jgi:ferritin-like metal-binding protein YciE
MAKATGKKAAAKAAAPKKAAAKKAAAPAPKKAAAKKAAAPTKKAAAPKKAAAKKAAANTPVDQKSLLNKLFVDGLKDIYWAEKQLTKSLPKLGKAVTSDQLRQSMEEHRMVTEQQIGRLEQVFQSLGLKAVAKKCEAMDGLTREADSIVAETQKGTLSRDAGIIMATQKVEHYEIASYGSLAQLASTLGLEEVKNLLGQTLQEEKDQDERLSQLAVSSINLEAEKEQAPAPVQEEEKQAESRGENESDPVNAE